MRKIWGVMLLLSVSFAAEVVTFDNHWAKNPLFSVVSQTPMGCELIFSMHEMVTEEAVIDGVPMKSFGVPAVFIAEPGVPNFTGASRYIAIPQGATAQVLILDVRTEVYHNVDVAPAPNIPREDNDEPLRYEKNMAIYGRDAYYPASPVRLSAPSKMRGVDVVIVGVIPFQYNPVTKELIVYKDIRFRIDFVGGNGHFGEDRLRSRFWEPLLQNNLLNYSSLPKIDFYSAERTDARDGYEYIIIVPDDVVFEAWGDTIKLWRKLQGISCEVFTLTEVGGSSATAIENFLDNAYNTWDPAPVAFLLLSDYPSSGDAYGITSPVWSSYCVSDNIYADVDDDDLPDMHHARICAKNETHLNTIINKFLSYERNPYTAANFYDEPLCACGWQDDRWFQLASEVVRGFLINELGKSPARRYNLGSPANPTPGGNWSTRTGTAPVVAYWNAYGYVPLTNPYDATWWNNGSAAGVNTDINSGAFFVQHRDHGSTSGWGEPDYDMDDLDGLTNTMFTFVNSTNCLTGMYNNSSQVFAEKFHRIDYGAWGVNAATEVSYSFVNDTYIWGMWDCLYPDFDPGYPVSDLTGYDNLRPCMAMTSGKYYLDAMWFPDSVPGAGTYRVYTYHLFHHHGDAFVTLYSEIPDSLSVSHAPALLSSDTSFTVTANDSSVIALTVNGEIIGVAEGTGAPYDISIPSQTPGNFMKVTVTKANYYRYEADVPITSPNYPFLIFSKALIDDSSGGNNDGVVNPAETIDYGIWAKNVGTGTAQSVYGLLSESDAYVTIAIDSSWYGDIPEDDSSLSSPYYTFSTASDCPNGHTIDFTLDFHDGNDSIWTSSPSITVYAPVLTYSDVSVVNDNNSNGILDPDEIADLVVTIENEGGAVAENVISTLLTTSPYITINDSSGDFGSIDTGTTANNSSDPYNVTADSATPTGTAVQFELEVVSGVYVDTLEFSIAIGKKHYYLWNADPTSTPGYKMDSILVDLGYSGDHGTALAPDLSLYQSVLVCVGIYPENYVIASNSPEAAALVDYLENQDGRMYLEGGDVWYWDPTYENGYDFGSLFGINPVNDGSGDLGPVNGESGAFTNGMNFTYGGENNYMDHINPTGTGFLIFHDGDDLYNCGVANDAVTYRTVGTSFELGLLNDGTAPSTRAVLLDSIMKFFGIGIPEDAIPPSPPYITQAEKSGIDVELTWNTVTIDTLGNPETMDCYVVYRNISPSFIPAPSDSIGVVLHPDTTYTDLGVLDSSDSYYYLVKAVDDLRNRSEKSNMGYKFSKFFNENSGPTSDRNWVCLPWYNEYSTVSDLTADLSPAGNPLVEVTNLRDDQLYENYTYIPGPGWLGTDFSISSGCGYEMVTNNDTILMLVGANNPDGLVNLNENPEAVSDRNWVSIPYNAIYNTVSDITAEYSPTGDPLVEVTNLRDDQLYENYTYIPGPGWLGIDFSISPGRGYEFVVNTDTTWNPTEYTNEADSRMISLRKPENIGMEIYLGKLTESDRAPVWQAEVIDIKSTNTKLSRKIDYLDARVYEPIREGIKKEKDYRDPGISHVVYATLEPKGFENFVFTVYRPNRPYDVLTENTVASGIAKKDAYGVVWFNVGNFRRPWQDGEEVILIVEALKQDRGYFTVVNFELNKGVDIQEIGKISLAPIPAPEPQKKLYAVRWSKKDDDNIVGYSIYQNDKRLNNKVIAEQEYFAQGDVNLKPVIKGGYETVYGSQGLQSTLEMDKFIDYAFSIFPNPFTKKTRIDYALPKRELVDIEIYDVTGRQVKTIVSKKLDPGYYEIDWFGDDNKGRKLAAGVYFIQMKTEDYKSHNKVIFLR